jgi:ABC-type Zn uptake system ZnuABC Zn-binding protein ZnuA
MKKVLFVFAVAGLVTLASCGGNKEEAKTEATDSTKVETTVVDTTAVVADTTKKVETAAPAKEVKKEEKKK